MNAVLNPEVARPPTPVPAGPAAHRVPRDGPREFLEQLLAEQHQLTAVERFARVHDQVGFDPGDAVYRRLLPARPPGPGEQYAFEVDLDRCSGCKACVSACHSLNGLEEDERWRSVGLLVADTGALQHVTTACHHCADPGCLNGCPVLAYDKDPATGIVRHLDDQCMGCSYCVLKCPYEVPRYSSRLGIVRKCDLCANRLAADEAPACVQGCPHEAIRITTVNTAETQAQWDPTRRQDDRAVWLPDAPDPTLTQPTTRYASRHGWPEGLRAADRDILRLDPPHWPLVFLLVLTQAAAGVFLAVASIRGLLPEVATRDLGAAGLLLLGTGLAMSVLHLGRPIKAWRAFLGWRRSWLSREILALNAFAGAAATSVAAEFLALPWPGGPLTWSVATAGLGLLGVLCSAMVYVDTGRPSWAPARVAAAFIGATLILGGGCAVVGLMRAGAAPVAWRTALALTLAAHAAFSLGRHWDFRHRLARPDHPLRWNARVIRELLTWTRPLDLGLATTALLTGLLAFEDVFHAAGWWMLISVSSMFGAAVLNHHLFFVAGARQRMPGGITP